MTADEIEFFISNELPDELGKQEEMGGDPRRRRPLELDRTAVVAVLLLAAASALPTVAAFQGVYTVRQRGGRGISVSGVSFGADGWGRYHEAAGGDILFDVPSGVHEIRYGIPLVVCAAVLALLGLALAGTFLVRASSMLRRRVLTVAAPIALTAAAVLGGVVASMWLHVQSEFDTLHAQLDAPRRGFGINPRIETGIGACVWLALASVVAGLLAAGALWYSARAESGAEEGPGKLA